MTDETAMQISEMLLESLRQHGFGCIGSFSLNETNPDAEVSNEYKYADTETALNELEQQTKIRGEARTGLETLVDVALKYFTAARSIPSKFIQTFPLAKARESAEGQLVPQLVLGGLNEEVIDLNSDLNNNKDLDMLIELLSMIRQNINLGDEAFFNSLNRFN